MATSKTLTPTNVTISIPAMSDRPNQSVNSNCIDKLADAVNDLNGRAKAGFISWGTTLTVTGFRSGILIYNAYTPVTIWLPSTDTVTARWIGTDGTPHYKTNTSNQLQFSIDDESGTSITLTRSGTSLTFTVASNCSALFMYY